MLRDVKFVVLGVFAVQLALGTNVDPVELHVLEDLVHEEADPGGVMMVTFVARVRPLAAVAVEVILEAGVILEPGAAAVAIEDLRLEVNFLDVTVPSAHIRKLLRTVVAGL